LTLFKADHLRYLNELHGTDRKYTFIFYPTHKANNKAVFLLPEIILYLEEGKITLVNGERSIQFRLIFDGYILVSHSLQRYEFRE